MVTMEDRAAHRRLLTNLLDQCGRHLNIDMFSGPFNAYQSSVPYELKTGMPPDERLKHFSLRLWQFGVSEVSHVKGAPPLHGVRDCLQRFLAETGCETSRFPLEILFEWPNQWQQSPAARPRDPVEDFSLAVSIGSSVTLACHLLCWAAAKLDWLGSEDFLPFDLRFQRVLEVRMQAGTRKLRHDLLTEIMQRHNKATAGKSRLTPDEILAIYLQFGWYDQAPEAVRRQLKIIWGTESCQHTAVTLHCVCMPFFNPLKPQTGPFKVNPLWHEIVKHSWAKVEEMFIRLETKWNSKIQEYLDRSCSPPVHQPSLCGPFRDSGREQEVYLMSCTLGLLDGKLLAEVTAMRPDLKAADLICQSLQSCGPDLPLDLDIDEEEDERVRLLTSLARSLKKEQDAMRAHRVAHQRYTAQTIASEREWQKGV
ncbi:unnamed protein product, partial [Symbiodinium pilosum]